MSRKVADIAIFTLALAAGVLLGALASVIGGLDMRGEAKPTSVTVPLDKTPLPRKIEQVTDLQNRFQPQAQQPSALPRIAIIIDDLGLLASQTQQVADLPGPLTLSFLPYAKGIEAQAKYARNKGHAIFLHLPMEPMPGERDDHGPGPSALLTSMSETQLKAALSKNLSSLTSYDGVNNHMGSKFTTDAKAMKLVLTELKDRDLVFVDSVTSGTSKAEAIAEKLTVPSVARDIFLDADFGKGGTSYVQDQLEALEKIARQQGQAVAIGHPYATTLEALGPWLVTAPARGFEIVLVSDLAREHQLLLAASTSGDNSQ